MRHEYIRTLDKENVEKISLKFFLTVHFSDFFVFFRTYDVISYLFIELFQSFQLI
jgi:hypothetical protein